MKLNKLLDVAHDDKLFLLNIKISTELLKELADVEYVVMQGSSKRSYELSKLLAKRYLGINPELFMPRDLSQNGLYSVYKIGKVLSISHGMGNFSVINILHEITRLLYFAGVNKPKYIRIGTCGGLGVAAGSVILTDRAYTPLLENNYEIESLGEIIKLPSYFDNQLTQDIKNAQKDLSFTLIEGNTIAADDFYMGQFRFDGAIRHDKTEEDKQAYFATIKQLNIVNFEMECSALSAFCLKAEIPAAMLATVLVNRQQGDQITLSPEKLTAISNHGFEVLLNYLDKYY